MSFGYISNKMIDLLILWKKHIFKNMQFWALKTKKFKGSREYDLKMIRV